MNDPRAPADQGRPKPIFYLPFQVPDQSGSESFGFFCKMGDSFSVCAIDCLKRSNEIVYSKHLTQW